MEHLTRCKRNQLQALRFTRRFTQQEMAGIIGCSQSAVSRELSRNTRGAKKRYSADKAHSRSEERRAHAYVARKRWHDDRKLFMHVLKELRDGKSPDQIAGRMKRQKQKHMVSHQTIYTYIERDKRAGGALYKSLRYQGKKFKWRGIGGSGYGQIPNRIGIEERPQIVTEKKRCGDWESDLVVSPRNGSGAVATFAERKSMYFKAIRVADQSADEMVRASKEALHDMPRYTMTHDNGREITKHEKISEQLDITIYCAHPYRSCERGLNEFMNRELRQFFPKGTDFSLISQSEVDSAVKWLNNCPRRSLQYRTPQEVLDEQLQIMHFTL